MAYTSGLRRNCRRETCIQIGRSMFRAKVTTKNPPARLARAITALLRNDSRFYLQLLALVPLAVLQLSLLPALLAGYVICNVITVWVVLNAVLLRLPQALTLALLSALLLETHSTAPRGLYLCAYGTLVGALHLIKGLVTWNMRSAWLVVVVAAELWLSVLEHVAVAMPGAELWPHSSKYLLRLGGTCLVGYLLFKYVASSTHKIR